MSEKSKLENAFINGLELPSGSEVHTLKYREIPEWDSIGHMALIAEIEDAFEVSLSTEQVIDLSSYIKAVEILKTHGIDGLE